MGNANSKLRCEMRNEMRDSELEIWNEKCEMRNSKCEMLN